MRKKTPRARPSAVSLEALGWGDPFRTAFEARARPGEMPARVVEEQRQAYFVQSEAGERFAGISGRLRHAAGRRSDYPAVGDWVAITQKPGDATATIEAVLPRRSTLSRKSSGQDSNEQLIATNLDIVFIVSSLNKEFSVRRLERYLALVSACGALPVVLLNKADLSSDPQTAVRDLMAVLPGVTVLPISASTGQGLDALQPYLKIGVTVTLIGSSGVGKSTLINRLIGWESQTVNSVRIQDDRGRHTTTFRRLIPLPQGGLLIDTPGIRELQLWETENVDESFDDIRSLMDSCRFTTCKHQTDAGCAVRLAIQDGRISLARYENYLKLKNEAEALAHQRETEAATQASQRVRQIRADYKSQS